MVALTLQTVRWAYQLAVAMAMIIQVGQDTGPALLESAGVCGTSCYQCLSGWCSPFGTYGSVHFVNTHTVITRLLLVLVLNLVIRLNTSS